jgi:hypothetical protein
MEVVEVDLASCLKFVDQVKEAESEHRARLSKGGREPPNTKQLDSSIARSLEVIPVTKAICNPHGLYTRDIEKDEVNRPGGKRTRTADAMTKLVGSAQVEEGRVREE